MCVARAAFFSTYKRNGNTRKAAATIKRTLANACDAVGDRDTRQAATLVERILADACDVIADY